MQASRWLLTGLTAAAIVQRIRAFDPFPGAASQLDGETVKLEGRVRGGAEALSQV